MAKFSQAYIHSRMRRRTADFLQGNAAIRGNLDHELTISSPSEEHDPKTKKRRERQLVGALSRYKEVEMTVDYYWAYQNTKYKLP